MFKPGTSAALFPGIGCGECARLQGGRIPLRARATLGVQVDAFATHVLVPHPRYLIDHVRSPPRSPALHVLGLTAAPQLDAMLFCSPSGA